MSNNNISAKNRIAKNMLFLYFRMIAVTLLSLITVKYTLQILGISDYGIYNIIGGVVTFLTFVNATMSSATQRFLSFELGRNDMKSYNKTFNTMLLVFVGLSVILLLIFEAFAHPLVYTWLQIPDTRRPVAEIVYHLSVLSFITSFMVIPFVSSILANERMGVYAYITMADTVSKLVLLAILFFSVYDKLLSYAIGILVISILTNLIYVFYNQKYISSTHICYHFEKGLFGKMIKFIGWSFFGSISGVMCNQGLSILMNIFFGVTVNAAKAISDRIINIVQSFVMNFYMAVSPQITKTYAAGNPDETIKLAFCSTRLAYFLMLIISVPLIILTTDILQLWLTDTYTDDMAVFTQLSLLFVLVNVFETPITFMIRATGDIKKYQICVGVFTLLVVPVSYLLYLAGCPASAAFICEIIIYAFVQIIRVQVAKRYYQISLRIYYREVLKSPFIISTAVTILSIGLYMTGSNNISIAIFATLFLAISIWLWGLRQNEKDFIIQKISFIFKKRNKI